MKQFRSRVKQMNIGGVKYKVHMSRHYNDPPKKMADQKRQHPDDYIWSIYIDSDKQIGLSRSIAFNCETTYESGLECAKAYTYITRNNVESLFNGELTIKELL